MKKMKRMLTLLSLMILLVTALAVSVSAASESDLTFKLNADGNSYSVTDCNTSASGELVIPATYEGLPVTRIGGSAFYGCSSLTSVTIPNSVTSISDSTFYNCSSLTSVTIPDSVTSIGWHAFYNCSSLTSVTIPNSVTSIDVEAFSSCSSLTSVTFPDSVTFIGIDAFYGCSSLTSVHVTDIAAWCSIYFEIYYYDAWAMEIVGESLSANPLYYAQKLYLNGELVTNLVIPDGVTSIGAGAFVGCSSLASVVIPDSVTSIDERAFSGCSSLDHVFYGGTQEQWGNISIDSENSNLTSATRHYNMEGYTQMGCAAKGVYCSVCEKTVAPGTGEHSYDAVVTEPTCTNVGYTTYTCTVCGDSYTGGEVPTLEHSYEKGVCTVCGEADPDYIPTSGTCGRNITWVLSEDGVLTISGTGEMYNYYYDAPWYGSKDMIKAVVIENGVTGIGECAFATCANLVNVTIADSVTGIGAAAFNNCDSIVEIRIPNSVTTIGNAAFCASDGLVNMVIPDSVTRIDGSLFNNCIGLRSVIIGNGLVEIPGHDFAFCENLEEVIIGESVASIGGSTFAGCSSLSRVVFRGDAPVFEDDAFRGISATVYYPVGNTTWTEDVKQNYGGNITWLVDCEHSYNAVVTPPSCIEVGYTTYTCSVCGDSYTGDEVATLEHSYEKGVCTVCGEEEPIVKFELRGSSMTLGNPLEINFAVAVDDLTGENNYIVVSKEYADGSVVTQTYPQSEWVKQSSKINYISFSVTAKEMNDKLTAIVYNENGRQISNTYEDSVAGYCLRKLAEEEEEVFPADKDLTLYVDMLNYGAAAQTKWSYNTDALANAGLTEEQCSYATVVTEKDNILQKGEGYYGTSLSLKDNILMNIAYEAAFLADVTHAVVTFVDHNGNDESVTVAAQDFIAQGTKIKYISLECMAVADYAQPVTIQLYNAEGLCVSTTIDSMGSYAGRQTKDVYLYEAILAFGMGAYNYFHS